jgi:hypothetical protein
MKVLVFVDHDILCRHFVMSEVLAPLVAQADVRFVFPDDGGKRVKLDPATLPLGAPFERLPIEGPRQQAWRWLLYADQLRPRRGAHEAAIRKIRWTTLGWKAALLLTLGSIWPGTRILRRMVESRFTAYPGRALTDLLARERPDVVLHPTVLDGVFINDLVTECRARRIPLVLAMNSWDNPSTKRAVVGRPDWLLVWGPQTADHAVRFIGLDPARVIPFGVAQFDVFRSSPRQTRAEFCAAHGIDPSRRVILFAGSNAQTDEFAVLQALDSALGHGDLADVSVVYRPHPWGGGGRDGARLAAAQFRHIVIDRTMRDYLARIAREGYGISLPDYRDTHDLLSAVDGVVSPMSTILVEAALHGKPVAAYQPIGADASDALTTSMPMLHFSDFLALPDVLQPRTVDDLIRSVAALADPLDGAARGARLRRAADRFVTPFDRPWRERIVEFLAEAAGKPVRRIESMKQAAQS